MIFIGRGTPVLLLHSSMSTKLQWYKLMRAMSTDYLAAAVDLYGYGDAPFPENRDNFSLSDEVDWVESTLSGTISLNEPFHLVGHSYGAVVALRLAYKLEERVRSLVLFEPVAYHLLPEKDEGLTEALLVAEVVGSKIRQGKYAEAAEYFLDYYSAPGTFSRMPDFAREILAESIKKVPLDFHALVHEPLAVEDYSRMKISVCLIASKQSPVSSRRAAEFLSDKLPDCCFHWVKGGHMIPIYQPDEVNPIIEKFIREHQ